MEFSKRTRKVATVKDTGARQNSSLPHECGVPGCAAERRIHAAEIDSEEICLTLQRYISQILAHAKFLDLICRLQEPALNSPSA